MIKNTLQINSLRLCKLFGGSISVNPVENGVDWLYNGSVKFEEDFNTPKVFEGVAEAFSYFTTNLDYKERVIGQIANFALGSINTWVAYCYQGTDCTDENYGNPENWYLLNTTETSPGAGLEARVKFLEDTLAYYTEAINKNGYVIVGSDNV